MNKITRKKREKNIKYTTKEIERMLSIRKNELKLTREYEHLLPQCVRFGGQCNERRKIKSEDKQKEQRIE